MLPLLGENVFKLILSFVERDGRGGDGNENTSNYSSNTSVTNASSSSYLLPSFACKRRIPGKLPFGSTVNCFSVSSFVLAMRFHSPMFVLKFFMLKKKVLRNRQVLKLNVILL